MRVILTGDIHIGRVSSKIPNELSNNSFRASSAWERIVSLAIEQKADLLCLSGDIVDQTNKFWEAIGSLKKGIELLAEHEIQTVAVSGNHDFDVLPKIAHQLQNKYFTLLGRNGQWQRHTVTLKNGEALNIDGWSFPNRSVLTNPFNSYNLESDSFIPTLGMVHGDLNSPSSSYAPLDLNSLTESNLSGWLLGHIHAPRLINSSTWVLYPGSPQALDPGEEGIHGPWIVELSNNKLGLPKQIPLSTIYYGNKTIDLTEITVENELYSILINGIQDEKNRIQSITNSKTELINLRLRLIGHTAVSSHVKQTINQIISEYNPESVNIEKIDNFTLPKINLQEYSKSKTAVGAIAGLLLELEKETVSKQIVKLISDTTNELEKHNNSKNYSVIAKKEISETDVRSYLKASASQLLTHLIEQTDG